VLGVKAAFEAIAPRGVLGHGQARGVAFQDLPQASEDRIEI
jgi:hypothetical protein